MNWKVGVAFSIVTASLFTVAPAAVGAEAERPPAAAEANVDTIEDAVARAAELSKRVDLLGDEAAKQRAQLEALRLRLVEDFKQQAVLLVAKGKELDEARGQVGSLQKQVGDLRAAVSDRAAGQRAQADASQLLKAKDAELATLRAEVEKLQQTIAEAREQREKTVATAPGVGHDTSGIQSVSATATSADMAEAPTAPPADATAIKKWQRSDGGLFFGERPPPGSKFIGYTTGGGL